MRKQKTNISFYCQKVRWGCQFFKLVNRSSSSLPTPVMSITTTCYRLRNHNNYLLLTQGFFCECEPQLPLMPDLHSRRRHSSRLAARCERDEVCPNVDIHTLVGELRDKVETFSFSYAGCTLLQGESETMGERECR